MQSFYTGANIKVVLTRKEKVELYNLDTIIDVPLQFLSLILNIDWLFQYIFSEELVCYLEDTFRNQI